PARGALVVVSGGRQGVGDLPTAVETALHYGAQRVVALTGHNAALRERLHATYAGEERVLGWDFTDRMVTPLAAADGVIPAPARSPAARPARRTAGAGRTRSSTRSRQAAPARRCPICRSPPTSCSG